MSSRSAKRSKVGELVELFRASGSQDAAFDALAAERLGVSRTDLECLTIVERRGGASAGEIATESGLTSGAVTGVIDRLERAGYAARAPDPTDRRRVLVEVTATFRERAGEIWGPMAADWEELISARFTAAELDRVAEFLRLTTDLGARHAERLRET